MPAQNSCAAYGSARARFYGRSSLAGFLDRPLDAIEQLLVFP
jgi:hypothetical protein